MCPKLVLHSKFQAVPCSCCTIYPLTSCLPPPFPSPPISSLSFTSHIPPSSRLPCCSSSPGSNHVPSGGSEHPSWPPCLTSHRSSLHTAVRLSHTCVWAPTAKPKAITGCSLPSKPKLLSLIRPCTPHPHAHSEAMGSNGKGTGFGLRRT